MQRLDEYSVPQKGNRHHHRGQVVDSVNVHEPFLAASRKVELRSDIHDSEMRLCELGLLPLSSLVVNNGINEVSCEG